jgi:hypothetical protein
MNASGYTAGHVWSCQFTDGGVVIASKETGAGKIEVRIDGKPRETIDLSVVGMRQAQQLVFKVKDLTPGNILLISLIVVADQSPSTQSWLIN